MLSESELLDDWTLQYCNQILPVHTVAGVTFFIMIFQQHETVVTGIDLLMDIVGMILKMYHFHLTSVPRHENKDIAIIGIMMGHLFYYLEQTVIATAHVCHARNVVEVL